MPRSTPEQLALPLRRRRQQASPQPPKVPAPPLLDVYAGSPADQMRADMEKNEINAGGSPPGSEVGP